MAQRQATWQQEVNYTLYASLNDKTHTLSARVQMEYVNNSPHVLHEIYIHLWPNAYKDNSTAFAKHELQGGNTDFHFASEQKRGYIDSLAFTVNGNNVTWALLKDTIDVCRLQLNEPLLPGARITIATPFKVKFPAVFSRMGHKGEAYAATQWYPKPAVYDANGWNYMPYLNQGEFYSEFGNFTVTLTVPASYKVAAAGELQNEEEQEWLSKGARSDPKDSAQVKTLTFRLNQAHDFAWFAMRNAYYARSKAVLPSGKEVTIQAFSMRNRPEASLTYIANALVYYSREVGEYPYSICTAVEGPLEAGGGMEYPTITICSQLDETVVLHEVGHNWFYGILGSNERQHPWMDEGINSFYENSYFAHRPMIPIFQGKRDPFNLNPFTVHDQAQLAYLLTARRNTEQALNLPAQEYSLLNYGSVVYLKSYLVLNHLREYLGKPLFDSCMKTYYETWKFRHPLPDDFRDVFERVSGKNLSWFFDGYLQTTRRNNYAITSIRKNNGQYVVRIRNKGQIAAPFSISTKKNGTITSTQWVQGFTGKQYITLQQNDADEVVIDAPQHTPDYQPANNSIRTSGLLKRSKPLHLQWLGSLPDHTKQQVFFTPVAAWNTHNRWMAGMAIYNSILPARHFEYTVVPMYSFTSKDVNGYLQVQRTWHRYSGTVKNIQLGYDAARFRTATFGQQSAYYQRQAPYMQVYFRHRARSSENSFIKVRPVFVYDEEGATGMDYEARFFTSRFVQTQYAYACNKALNPWGFRLWWENGKDYYIRFDKLTAEWKSRFNLGMKKKNFDVRVFAAKMFTQQLQSPGGLEGRYFLHMGGNSAFTDYTYDYTLMGRGAADGLLAQQVLPREGGFKTLVSLGRTNNWLVSANLRCDIPGILPIKLFLDLGAYHKTPGLTIPGSGVLIYNAGVILHVKEGVFEVYFPALASDDIKQSWELNRIRYVQRITFMLNLNALNPIDLVKGLIL